MNRSYWEILENNVFLFALCHEKKIVTWDGAGQVLAWQENDKGRFDIVEQYDSEAYLGDRKEAREFYKNESRKKTAA